MADKLDTMFKMRLAFMNSLNDLVSDTYPDIPLDLSKKADQRFCRDIALRGVEEMFEALQHLKNWKPHRQTEISDFDKDEFLEEIVDAFNYFFSLLILTGVDAKQLFEAYEKKDKIIHKRLEDGY
jgi:hypothetical protein